MTTQKYIVTRKQRLVENGFAAHHDRYVVMAARVIEAAREVLTHHSGYVNLSNAIDDLDRTIPRG